jgi:hypothetical protein
MRLTVPSWGDQPRGGLRGDRPRACVALCTAQISEIEVLISSICDRERSGNQSAAPADTEKCSKKIKELWWVQ